MAAEKRLVKRTLTSDLTGLTALSVVFDLPVASKTITSGTYFHLNDEVEVVAGMPIMPRTSVSVTLEGAYAHGAFFEEGEYQSFTPFDPVIARLITDTTQGLDEPLYDCQEWVPAAWDLVNSINTPQGSQQRLVILPAQYRAQSYSCMIHGCGLDDEPPYVPLPHDEKSVVPRGRLAEDMVLSVECYAGRPGARKTSGTRTSSSNRLAPCRR